MRVFSPPSSLATRLPRLAYAAASPFRMGSGCATRLSCLLILLVPLLIPSSASAQGACEGCNPCSPCDQMTTTGYPEYLPITCGECGAACEQCCVPNYQVESDVKIGSYASGVDEGFWLMFGVYERTWADHACGEPSYSECWEGIEHGCDNFYQCCSTYGCWGTSCH
jgi:hypothetical protein